MAIDHSIAQFSGPLYLRDLKSAREMNRNRKLFVCARTERRRRAFPSIENMFQMKIDNNPASTTQRPETIIALLPLTNARIQAFSRIVANYFSAQRNTNRAIFVVISLLLGAS